jgi:hypothetical protein
MPPTKPSTDLHKEYSIFGDGIGCPKEQLYRALAEGRRAVEEGRVRPLDEAMAELRKRIEDDRVYGNYNTAR